MRITTADITDIVSTPDKPEGTVDTAIVKDTGIEPPLSAYTEVKGTPYTVQYLDIPYYDELVGELDVDNIRGQVAELEGNVMARLQANGMNDTVESYKEIIGHIKQYLGISDNELPEIKLEKLNTYLRLSLKQDALENKLDKIHGQISKIMRHSF